MKLLSDYPNLLDYNSPKLQTDRRTDGRHTNDSNTALLRASRGTALAGASRAPRGFYPRDAMLARVIVIATCPSVRPSVRLSVCPSVCYAPVLCQNEES